MNRPHQASRVARRAARRALLRDLLRAGGWALLAASVVGVALVTADRAAGGVAGWGWLVALPIAGGLLAALLWAAARRPADLEAAGEVDRALGLKDRLSSALALEQSGRAADPAFAEWARHDGDSAAAQVRLAEAIPLRPAWTWWAWPPALAASILLAMFVPAVTWSRAQQKGPVNAEERLRAAASIEEAIVTVREALPAETGDLATPEQLRALEELQQQLERGAATPRDAVVEAASSLDEVADRLRSESEQRRLEHEAVARRLAAASDQGSGSEAATGDEGSASEALQSAMDEGDLEAAGEAARELLQDVETWTPEQREQLARDLEKMAERLEPKSAEEPAEAPPGAPQGETAPRGQTTPSGGDTQPGTEAKGRDREQPPDPRAQDPSKPADNQGGDQKRGPAEEREEPSLSERMRDELREQGVPPEQQKELDRPVTPEDARRELERRGVDPEVARRLAEELSKENQRREAERRAEEQVQDLRRSLEDAARDLRGQEPRGSDQEPARGEQKPGDQQQREGQGRQSPDPSAREGASPDKQPADREQPGDRRQSPQGGAEQGADRQGSQRQGEQPQGTQQQGTPSREQGRQQDQPKPGNDSTGEQEPGTQPRAKEQPRPVPSGEGQQQPGRDGAKEGAPRGGAPEPQPGGADPVPQQGDQPQQREQIQPGKEGQQGVQGDQRGRDQRRPGRESTPGEQEGQEPGRDEGGADGEKPARGRGIERLRQVMERMGKGAQEADHRERQAERIDQQAEELLKNLPAEDREQAERLARAMAREGSGTRSPGDSQPPGEPGERFDNEPVDARRPPPDKPRERVVAQWFTDEPAERGGEVGRAAMDEQLKRAAAGAERAIEQQVVPGRYGDLVRRVFRRYEERVAPSRGGPRAPAPERP